MTPEQPAADLTDLSDLLCQISASVSVLARADPEIYGRLVVWALAALQSDGRSPEFLIALLENRPTTPRQWWVLRQFLSAAALAVLLRHLEAALLTFERTYDQANASHE